MGNKWKRVYHAYNNHYKYNLQEIVLLSFPFQTQKIQNTLNTEPFKLDGERAWPTKHHKPAS